MASSPSNKKAPPAERGCGGGRKRPAKYLPHASFKRKKDLELHAGLQGFLITCDGGRERQSCREAISLLERFYDKLEGKHASIDNTLATLDSSKDKEESDGKQSFEESKPEKGQEDYAPREAAAEDPPKPSKCINIESLLNEEITELRDKTQARFVSLETGCSGIVFIRMLKDDAENAIARGPNEVVEAIMQECYSSRIPVTRFCLRFLPVQMTCYASEEEVGKVAKPFLLQHFPVGEGVKAFKFAVVYEARANTSLDRMVIINALAKMVDQPHSVDLTNPDKTIIVQIVKTICSIGVVSKYKQYAKYNLRQLTLAKEDKAVD